MKKPIILSLITILAACSTTNEAPEAVLYTEPVTPREYFAGAPQIPETTYHYPKKAQQISETNGAMFRLAASYVEPSNDNPLPDKALVTLEPISAINLNDYETTFLHRIRGYAYKQKGDYRKAIEEFNLMLNKRDYISISTEVNVTRTLASLHFELQEYNLSLEHMFKLPELLESPSSDDYYQVSRIQDKMGDYKNALKNVNKAILITGDSSPGNTNLYYEHMAKIYEKMNGTPQAE